VNRRAVVRQCGPLERGAAVGSQLGIARLGVVERRHFTDESIAALGDGLDESGRLPRVAECAPELRDTPRQRFVGDGAARPPNLAKQRISLYHVAGLPRE